MPLPSLTRLQAAISELGPFRFGRVLDFLQNMNVKDVTVRVNAKTVLMHGAEALSVAKCGRSRAARPHLQQHLLRHRVNKIRDVKCTVRRALDGECLQMWGRNELIGGAGVGCFWCS